MIRQLTRQITTLWTNGRTAERVGYTVAAILFTSGLLHVLVYAIDGGTWTGPVSWRKPITFGTSFGIVLATITWISTQISMKDTTRRILLGAITTTSIIEVAGITTQAWRGKPSHFNTQDPLSTAIGQGALATGGVAIIITLATLTVLSFSPAPQTQPSMRLAIRAGLLILMTAMASGAVMIATGVILTRTDSITAAYQHGGWLKPTHAVTMHAITVLPALALVLSCLDRTEAWRTRIVAIATGAYGLAVATTITVNIITAA